MHRTRGNQLTTRAQHFWLKKGAETHKALCGNPQRDPTVQAALCSCARRKRCDFCHSPQIIGCGGWGQSGKGRHASSAQKKRCVSGNAGSVTPRLSCVGVHLFAHWLDQQHAFDPVVAQLTQAVHA